MKDYTGIKVLVVDDMFVSRKIIMKYLMNLGISQTDIFQVDNGQKALNFIESEKVDLIISDWHMPELTGIELLQKSKLLSEYKSVPFVLLTSDAVDENIEQATNLGVEQFLIKPINEENFAQTITQILDQMRR